MNRAAAATLGALALGAFAQSASAQYPMMPAYPQPMYQQPMGYGMPAAPMGYAPMPMPMQYAPMPMQYAPMPMAMMPNGQVMHVAAYRQPTAPVMMTPARPQVPVAPMIAPLDKMTENGPLDPDMLMKQGAVVETPAAATEKPAAETVQTASAKEPAAQAAPVKERTPLYKRFWKK